MAEEVAGVGSAPPNKPPGNAPAADTERSPTYAILAAIAPKLRPLTWCTGEGLTV